MGGLSRAAYGTMINMQGDEKNSAGAQLPEKGKEDASTGSKGEATPRSFEWLGQVGNLISGLATAGALIFTAFSVQATQNQVTIARGQAATEQQGQLTDRFTKSVEQLGSDKLEVRVGGVYAMERIARDSPRDHSSVMDVLIAFVREQPPVNASDVVRYSDLPADLQESITFIVGQRDIEHEDKGSFQFVLDEAPLGGATLSDANLSRIDFRNADFQSADIRRANLMRSDLSNGYFYHALLNDANLSSTILAGANLEYADLRNADLRNADLRNADLHSASVAGANLDGANLDGANTDGTIGLPPRN